MRSVEEPLVCLKCDFQTVEPITHCPRCGQVLRTKKFVKGLGWVLVAMGAFLLIFMTGLIILIANIMAHSDDPGATTRFDGDSLDAAMVFGILGLVWVFGLASFAGGIFQVLHGRRNRMLLQIIIWLGAAFLAIGTLVQILE